MPKKTTSMRGGAQRNRARTQKSFELVRPTPTVQEKELEAEETVEAAEATETARNNNGAEAVSVTASTAASATGATTRRRSSRPARPSLPQEPVTTPSTEEETPDTITAPASTESASPKSAAARLAARRTAAQKAQRIGVNLITAEHYAYVRADLIKIAILALIMFGIIIGLHFVPGIGS